jgi:hypothetical protein
MSEDGAASTTAEEERDATTCNLLDGYRGWEEQFSSDFKVKAFYPEDRDKTFLRIIGTFISDYTV